MFGDVAVVRAILKKYTDELDQDDINTFLNMATRDIQSEYSTEYWDRFDIEDINGQPARVYKLYFEAKRLTTTAYIEKVFIDDYLIADTEYTLAEDHISLTIETTTNLTGKEKMYVYYYPAVFDDLASYKAALNVLLTRTLNVGENSIIPALVKNLKEQITALDKSIKHKPEVVPVVMHRPKMGMF